MIDKILSKLQFIIFDIEDRTNIRFLLKVGNKIQDIRSKLINLKG